MENKKAKSTNEINELFVPKGRQRSFGRTSSRMSLEEQSQLDARLEPFALHIVEGETVDLPKVFSKHNNNARLIIELGIGNGMSLAKRANECPANRYIGAEVYKNGLQTLAINIEKNQLQNLRVCNDDARRLLENLPPKSVDELVILYPDPWPKKRHNKRRIIQQDLLKMADKILKNNGLLFIATDIPDYAMWIVKETYSHGEFFPIATSPAEWAKAPDWWLSTKYEQKAIKAGRQPWYLTFRRGVDKSNTKCSAVTTN